VNLPPNKRSSRSTVSSEDHPSIPKISDRLEELHLLAQQLSTTTSEVERWIKAINNLSSMVQDRKNLNDLVSFLYNWQNKSKGGKQAGNNPTKKSRQNPLPHHPISRDGDSLYDIINAPNFTQIVEKVMARKKRRKRI
jgi:hypothetical protein